MTTTHGIFAGGTIMKIAVAGEWQIMSPSGMPGPTYTAMTAEEAAQKAEKDGYEILDIQDRYLVIADDERG